MKIISRIFLIVVMFLSTSVLLSFAGPEKYGADIVNRQTTPISDILASPKDFAGKTVTVEGKIAQECPSGCWFYLKMEDKDATIYVDIGKSGLAIPQYKGKKILVEGEVITKLNTVMIQGKGVEIK